MKMIFKLLATLSFVIAYGCIGGIDVGNLTILKGLVILVIAVYAGFGFAELSRRVG